MRDGLGREYVAEHGLFPWIILLSVGKNLGVDDVRRTACASAGFRQAVPSCTATSPKQSDRSSLVSWNKNIRQQHAAPTAAHGAHGNGGTRKAWAGMLRGDYVCAGLSSPDLRDYNVV